METIRENYPSPAFYGAMNFLSTHDTPRLLTLLGCKQPPADRDARAHYRLSPAERERGTALLKLAALVLYAFPGSPTVYYGDEAGMDGFEDPFNRRTYPWGHEDTALLDWFRTLGRLRAERSRCKAATLPTPLLRAACSALPAARTMRSPSAPSTPVRRAPRSTCRGQRRSRTTRSAASRFWPKAVGCISPSPPTTLCC